MIEMLNNNLQRKTINLARQLCPRCRCCVKNIGLWNEGQLFMDWSKWQPWTVEGVRIILSLPLTSDRWDTDTLITTTDIPVPPARNGNRSQIEGSQRFAFLFQRHCPTHRIITHYYYPAWPDRGVPQDPSSLCFFAEHIRKDLEAGPQLGPAVVHCRSESQAPHLVNDCHIGLPTFTLFALMLRIKFCSLFVRFQCRCWSLRDVCGPAVAHAAVRERHPAWHPRCCGGSSASSDVDGSESGESVNLC